MQYIVTASSLRLRRGPSIKDVILTTLGNGQLVDLIKRTNAEWWQVNVVINSKKQSGYVSAKYLAEVKVAVSAESNPHKVIAIHYPVAPTSKRSSANSKHSPLSESDLPKRAVGNKATASTKVAAIHKIVNYLDVEKSLRYQRNPNSTFCNIYAYDFCYCTNAYLPRVWWTSKTLMEFAKTPGYNPKPIYGTNVTELNANSLYNWLEEWGDDFGWKRSFDLTELQSKVNEGRVGIICARKKDLSRSGHITCVVPEAGEFAAARNGSLVLAPLQSQAGAKNKKYFASVWWIKPEMGFSAYGYWWHE